MLPIIGLLILFSSGAFFLFTQFLTSPKALVSEANRTEHIWNQQIRKLGGEKAYENFKKQYLSDSPTSTHPIAHTFGELLYKHEGLAGFTICSSDFMYGCYHGFFTSAVVQEGEGITEKLYQLCEEKFGKKPTACEHGIGHGLYEYYGGSRLNEALAKCALVQTNPLLGCSSGVFMENNFPSATETSLIPKQLHQDNLFDPCTTVPAQFADSCYYEQPSYWMASKITFPEIIDLCNNLTSESQRLSCIKGSGLAASKSAKFEPEATVKSCSLFKEESSVDLCLQGGYWGLLSHSTLGQAAIVCNSSSDPSKCFRGGDLRRLPTNIRK